MNPRRVSSCRSVELCPLPDKPTSLLQVLGKVSLRRAAISPSSYQETIGFPMAILDETRVDYGETIDQQMITTPPECRILVHTCDGDGRHNSDARWLLIRRFERRTTHSC